MNPLIQLSTASNPLLVKKTFLQTMLAVAISVLAPIVAHADSATWDLNPGSGDWNTAANWTPMGVPNGPADIATFALSNTTNVSISANTEVNGITFTSAAKNPYFIRVSSGLTLTLSGTGITNNSGIEQSFVLADATFEGTQMLFTNSASAGNANIFNDHSSVQFFNSSTAGSASINTDGASVSFSNISTAGSAFIGVTDNSLLQFGNTSTAGNATIAGAGFIEFSDFSSAGNATIISAGLLSFNGSSRGGTAQIELLSLPDFGYFAVLDISDHGAPGITIGSIEGNESTTVFLGANNLTVGSNNLSATFSGVIRDAGSGGSLTKIGAGTLNLTGANTYTGNTNINRGVLQVDGSITSNTFVNHGGTLAGGGTVNGNVTNNGRVSPGEAPGVPGMLTVVHNYTQAQYATLMIQIAGTSAGQFSVLDVLGNANLKGYLDPVLLDGFVPTIGQTFTFPASS
jgi:autotransporter-associated beta strand protein